MERWGGRGGALEGEGEALGGVKVEFEVEGEVEATWRRGKGGRRLGGSVK